MFATGNLVDELYYLNLTISKLSEKKALIADISLWHARLGHVHKDGIKHLSSSNVVNGLTYTFGCEKGPCISCVYCKRGRDSIPKGPAHRSKDLLELVHTDVGGPLPVKSKGGPRFYVTFTDDY